MKNYIKYIFLFSIILSLNGCISSEDSSSIKYEKNPQGWYDAIEQSVARGELEKADKQFIAFRGEYMNSKLLPTTMLILAQAHMANGEYLLAKYYLDEYLKLSSGTNADYARFLKLKASFLSIKDINKDQEKVVDTLNACKSYYSSHKSSKYSPLVQTMIVRLEMSQYILNNDIANLYKKIGKPKAAKIYEDRNKKFVFKPDDINPPENGFLSAINPF